ncbi:RANBP2-like and GRIP domain-containing protein 8 [Holothuria leucospilota]|uniref:RANBP2-like and GRIP domain-containing protein 8 n=1 Tax=Holothuria leucospilota TaxID=206669 RepID=A0A9Q1BPR6_HOLLE|nr:RANBP2-like and GRIP domain-containing protein 8 [Holothuria leucospilota]
MDSMLASCTDENSLQHFINISEELLSSDKQTSRTSRAVINLFLARCHLIQLILCKLPTSDLQDEIIRFGQRWMQLAPHLDNLNEIFKYPCQKLYISEIRAQFHYILGTCLLQMVQEKTVSEGDAISMATALFGMSLREGSKVKKNLLSMNWSKDDATVVSRLSCVRVSQTWHFLNKILELQERDDFIHHQEKWCNESGYLQMLNQVLGLHQGDDSNQWVKSLISQLSLHPLSTKGINSRDNQIVEIDYECIINDPNNMSFLVWTCIQWRGHDLETTPVFKVFLTKRGLPFSSSNLSHCSVLSLCILDIVIFLHAVANVMEGKLEKLQHRLELDSIPLMSYPYPILNLGNQRQIDWFNAVHQHLEVKDSSKDFIPVVEAGLEVLRCRSRKERMGTELLIYLGRTMKELVSTFFISFENLLPEHKVYGGVMGILTEMSVCM